MMRFIGLGLFIAAFAAVGVAFLVAARRDRARARRMAGRFPIDETNLPSGDPPRMVPWDRRYRGHLWEDPRPAGSDIDVDKCDWYARRAERVADHRRLMGIVLLWGTGAPVGAMIGPLWTATPEVDWRVLVAIGFVLLVAVWGAFWQTDEAKHWDRVAETYRQRAVRLREAARQAAAEAAAREAAVAEARPVFGRRLRAAWNAFRRPEPA
ncbi:hypothetical protein AB0B28_04470 [Glycomyces sp. NPDC046736]|uniref:hypothetical protein n=1 Tax=Glycomyces sp. NPDC046736 TaxID=3155615 RepID=UPI0033FEE901